jgi:uncharacterized protein (TIGR00255 family)
MIMSMTGYGRGSGSTRLGEVQIELKSVNGKHLDLRVRTPRFLFALEPFLKKALQSRLNRGRVECGLSIDLSAAQIGRLKINQALAEVYYQAAQEMSEKLNLGGGLSVEALLGLPEVVRLEDPDIDMKAFWEEVRPAVEQALDSFLDMRGREGKALQEEFDKRLGLLQQLTGRVDHLRGEVTEQLRKRLRERVQELCESVTLDEGRLEQEIAYLADRADITEEVVRLGSHLEQFGEHIHAGGSCGRKLDCLLQEMFREINTIGSKTEQLEITRLVLDMKTEVDKLREQVQNVE